MTLAAAARSEARIKVRTYVALTLLFLGASVLVLLVGWRYRALNRQAEALTQERAVERASAMATLLGNVMATTFAQIGALHDIADLVDDAKQAATPQSAEPLLRFLMPNSAILGPDVAQVSSIGANGRLQWSNLSSSAVGTDLSEREHFRVFVEHPDRTDYIGRPVLGKVSGEWTVQSTRALRDSQGALRAVTVVSLRANMLQRLCRALDLDSRDAVVLLRDDGTVLMRNDLRYIGKPIPALGVPLYATRDGVEVYLGPSQLDGVDRIVASVAVPGLPLRVRVGLSRAGQAEAMGGVGTSLWHGALATEAAIVVLALACFGILWLLRRNAEQAARTAALADSNKWFHAVTQHMAEGAIVLDGISRGDFRIAFASERAGEILGEPAEQLVGGLLHTHFPEDGQERAALEREQIAAGTPIFGAQHTVLRRDGSHRTVVMSSLSAPKPENPAELRAVTLLRDITDEIQREADLSETRLQLDRILQLIPGVFYRSIRQPGEQYYRGLFVSRSVEDFLGVDVETASQPGFLSRMAGLNLAERRQEALNRAWPLPVADLEYPITLKGKRVWLRDTLRSVQRDDGVEEIVGFLSDISAERDAKEALTAAVQLGPGVLYRASVSDSAVRVSAAFGDPSRISNRRARGQPIDAANLGNRLTELGLAPAMYRASDDGPTTIDFPIERGGMTRWLRNTLSVSARDADTVEVVGYIVDVTHEKSEQLRLHQVTTLLTLGEMATGMAHELNQPLASISFAAQNAKFMLERLAIDDASLHGKLDRIDNEARRASKLVEHMRIFARNDQEGQKANYWQAALAGATEILSVRLRGCTLIDQLPADLPPVLGAVIPMEQMLINLIGNAIDAYEQAGTRAPREVTISGGCDGEYVVLRVADRAGGIPAEVLHRVCEPFFTTKPVGKGTGLGLALVFGTVTAMRGTLDIRNESGGAVFEIRTPRAPLSGVMPEHADGLADATEYDTEPR